MAISLATRTRRSGEHDWSGLERWRSTLQAQLKRHCRDENEVEDVVQETFLRAARHRRGVRDPEKFRSWLLRIAFNVLRDLRRRARTLPIVPLDEAYEVPSRAEDDGAEVRLGPWVVEREDALLHLRAVRRGMRDDDRRLLDAYYGGLDGELATLAAEEGIEGHLMKVHLFRARGRVRVAVRRRLERQGHAPVHRSQPCS